MFIFKNCPSPCPSLSLLLMYMHPYAHHLYMSVCTSGCCDIWAPSGPLSLRIRENIFGPAAAQHQ